MKEQIAERFIIAACIGIFGALVHVANQGLKAKRAAERIGFADSLALFITALFSSLVFGIIAMLISDNELHLYLAMATGAFMGLGGLTKVTDSALNVVLTIAAKK